MAGLRVGVIFGGRSVEHDVSIVTAHQAMEALSARHEVVPIYVTTEGRWLTGPQLNDVEVYRTKRFEDLGEEASIPPVRGFGGLQVAGGRLRGARRVELDVVVPAIHGTYGEDGTLQGLLELADIPYTGCGVTASAVGFDKVAMKAAFVAAGLPVVDSFPVRSSRIRKNPETIADEVEQRLGYPVFVKPVRAGSSVGIAKGVDRVKLLEALDVASRYDYRVMIERSMEGCSEINCSVLGGGEEEPRASVCEQPLAWEEFLSFQDKYMRGGKSGKSEGMASQERKIPAPISDELTKQVQENALTAFRAIDASGVARIDSFVKEDTGETWVMEINTVPGSFSFYLWEHSGVDFPELMQKMIDVALEEHAAKQDLMFTFDSKLLEARKGGKAGG